MQGNRDRRDYGGDSKTAHPENNLLVGVEVSAQSTHSTVLRSAPTPHRIASLVTV
jgi:hypothetical protein